MDIKTQKKITAILQVLREAKKPVGGTRIANQVKRYGINLSPRTARYYLAITDKTQLTKNYGKRGRLLTAAGREELAKSFIFEKVGLVAAKIDGLSYQMDFSLSTLKGNIILNISTIHNKNINKARQHIQLAFKEKLGMGKYFIIAKSGTTLGNYTVPPEQTAIGTICSVTINGILLKHGIPISSRFGGLLEMKNHQPVRFTQIIYYDGSTLDPLEIFIKGRMTSVSQTARTGNGLIGASFREIPAIAIGAAHKLKKKLDRIGLYGILMIGNPGQPLLDIPVSEGKAGMIVFGGLNPVAAAEENGLGTKNIAMGTLFPFKDLLPPDFIGGLPL